MSKEQLFDFMCEHFGEEYETIESIVYKRLYRFLINNDLKSFLQYLKTLNNVTERYYSKAQTVKEKISTMYYLHALLKVMNFINEQLGEEIYKW